MACPSVAFSQVSSGYYRVESVYTGQSLYIKSATPQDIDYSQGTISLENIRGCKDNEAKLSKPSTVIYLEVKSDLTGGAKKVDISAQGVSASSIASGASMFLSPVASTGTTYYASASYKGIEKYLIARRVRIDFKTEGDCKVEANGTKGGDESKFKFNIIDESNNYFGISPRIELNGEYYDPFYVAFPYSFSSTGMTAYYVNRVSEKGTDGKAYAIWSEAGISSIKAGTPLIIKCSSNKPEKNKLKINGVTGQALSATNIMRGAYRSCPEPTNLRDVVEYNPSTMRVLGTQDGKLVFKKSTQQYIGENEAYIEVPSNYPDVLELVTQSEYDNITGIDDITVDEVSVNPRVKGVYTIAGVRVADTKDFDKLPSGVYIVDGKQRTK